jgi:hypothetical protein
MKGRVILMGAAGALALAAIASSARADALVDEAKAVVEKATARADKWDGPTSGPKAVAKKTVVYVAGDMRNGGILASRMASRRPPMFWAGPIARSTARAPSRGRLRA